MRLADVRLKNPEDLPGVTQPTSPARAATEAPSQAGSAQPATRRALREQERAAQAIARTGAEARATARVQVLQGSPSLYTSRRAMRETATQSARELTVSKAAAGPSVASITIANPALGADNELPTPGASPAPLRLAPRTIRQAVPTAPPSRPARRARNLARKFTAGSALVFIGSLVAVTSLPAQAIEAPTLAPEVLSIEPSSQELDRVDADNDTFFARDEIVVTDPLAGASMSDDEFASYQAVADSEASGSSYGGDPAFPRVWEMLSTDYVQSPFPSLAQLRITSPFGYRPGGSHGGTDIAPGLGTEIRPVANGVVSAVWQGNNPGGGGYTVFIDHNIDGQFVQSWYAHMLPGSIQVEVGQVVDITTVIGQVGSSGRSTGPHLHLEMKNTDYVSFDPMLWLQTRESNLE